MKIKNITVFSLLFFIILLFPIYWYINSNDQDININGIKAVKSNLQNYKIIPIDKGGIKAPCLEILECEE
jgi:hypothetical protein|tara:strand:+ start:864 stop:1073 length:210 start_codon:yes stop_codon:yes gene_type:complete